jgi:predicted amidohydrolase YtcJ
VQEPAPSTTLCGARLFDPGTGRRWRGWLRMEQGRIAALGEGDPPEGGGPRLDLRGAFLLPGLHDAHLHFLLGGETLKMLDASQLARKDELLEAIARRAATVSAPAEQRAGWVLGYGLPPDAERPGLAELDEAARGLPLRIDFHDLHSVIASSAALARAGLLEPRPDPPGGQIERDAAGKPTGLLRENAALLLRPAVPPAGPAERRASLEAAQALALSFGITAIDDNVNEADLAAYRAAEAEGRLHLRVHGWRNEGNLNPRPLELPRLDGPRLKVDTLKLFFDGALGSRTAAMHLPYADGSRGALVAEPAALQRWMAAALRRDWRLAIHAIGDRAVGAVLDCFERLQRRGFPVKGRRHRIEHLQFLAPGDLERLAAMEIVPSVQPLHCGSDQDHFAGLVTAEQAARGYPWRSLKARGLRLPVGTDWPVEPLDPRLNLYHGTTRLSRRGLQLLDPAEALGVDELLKGMTADAAWAAGWERELGRLAPGLRADLACFEEDPAELRGPGLLHWRLRCVWSGGRLVHGSPQEGPCPR